MRVLWDSHRPLNLYLVAETDADRVLVALLRSGKDEVTIGVDVPKDVLSRVAKHLSREAEQAEDAALILMGSGHCPHGQRLMGSCPECLGVVGVQVRSRNGAAGSRDGTGDAPPLPDLESDDDVPF